MRIVYTNFNTPVICTSDVDKKMREAIIKAAESQGVTFEFIHSKDLDNTPIVEVLEVHQKAQKS